VQPRQAGLRSPAELDAQLGGVPDEPIAHLDHVRVRDGQANRGAQPGGQQLIGQHPDMLRVVAKFDHIEIAVGGEHQVALGSAPHASNLLDRDHCHGVFLAAAVHSSILEPAELPRPRLGPGFLRRGATLAAHAVR
jgi:hypothetical protein